MNEPSPDIEEAVPDARRQAGTREDAVVRAAPSPAPASDFPRAQAHILPGIVESMGDGLIVADASGRMLFVNPAAERILGLGRVDLPASEWAQCYGLHYPDSQAPYPADQLPLARAIRGEESNQVELLVRNPRVLEDRYISATGRPLRDAQGAICGGVVVIRDVTQRRAAEEEARKTRQAAEEANQAKSEFLANVSHEVRTPLNGILGLTELTLETSLTPVQRDYLQMVRSSTLSLLSVLNDLLDFSKIEAGKLELKPEPFDLRTDLAETLKPFAVRAYEKGLEFAYHVDGSIPNRLIGDWSRLHQVLSNLLANAGKFTERGEVVVEVSSKEFTAEDAENAEEKSKVKENPLVSCSALSASSAVNSCFLHFSVRDTGIGVPPEKQRAIFEPFVQVDGSSIRKYGGTGLGLAICLRLASLMGGRLWLESAPGQGSTFHFEVPLPVAEPGPEASVTGLQEDLCGAVVYLVEAHARQRAFLAATLTDWGARCEVRLTIEAVLEETRAAGRPATVLVDLRMLTDAQVRLVREQLAAVLVYSPIDHREVQACEAERKDAATRITRPIVPGELLQALRQARRQRGLTPPAVEPAARPADAERAAARCRPLHVLIAEDHRINQVLMVNLLRKQGHAVTLAGNGREAVEAFQRQRFDAILMDVQMPEMDGLEATARIRELEKAQPPAAGEPDGGPHIPIIALTAHALAGDRERCLRAGMDAYLAKPVDQRRLLQHLAELTGPLAGAEPPGGAEEPLPPEKLNDAEPMLDLELALVQVGGDRQLLAELAGLFLSELEPWRAQLQQASGRGDLACVTRLAHTIKGAAGTLAAPAVRAAALKLEQAAKVGDRAGSAAALRELERHLVCLEPTLRALGQTSSVETAP